MKVQDVFEAIADPNRRKILELLKKRPLSVGEIAENFEISGASLSHHLNKLKSANLVVSKRQGQNIIYSIHTTVFEDLAREAFQLFHLGVPKNEKLSKK